MRTYLMALAGVALLITFQVAVADDGTIEGAVENPEQPGDVGSLTDLGNSRYLVTPFESVSISETNVWPDNRHRAYWSESLLNVNGFLLFDVTGIPDDETITSMTLRCYLEDAFGSPANNPVVDVYYSADDGWTRNSVGPGELSLDVLLQDDVPFDEYIPIYDFVLDVGAHDWSVDLADNQICIGFKNDVTHYSYVYFFGAYGDPVGPPPELTIETSPPSPVDEGTWGRIKALFR